MTSPKDTYTATLSEIRSKEIADRRPGRAVLRISARGELREVVVDGPRVTIGSHGRSDVVLRDDAIGNVHCELRLEDGGVSLRDLDSAAGTWIGDVRVREVVLPAGGSFTLGGCTITVGEVGSVDVPVSVTGRFGELHGRGSRMGELFSKLERLAAIPIGVLVVGETGTGKDLIARGLHEHSDRRDGPFVVVDCTTLTEGIAESVLYGHAKGSFTGAVGDQAGLIEQAHGGTLFLDELGELPLSLQPKLLRALEQRQTRRIGESTYRPFDARVVAATNRDLLKMVGERQFRDDLYFRIAEVEVDVPPLRERGRGDVAMLADLFLAKAAEVVGRPLRFDGAAYDVLASASWPGNVRQLRNAVRYAAVLAEDGVVGVTDLPVLSAKLDEVARAVAAEEVPVKVLGKALRAPWGEARREWERVYVQASLERAKGNQSEAAREAGMSRSAFRELLKRAVGGGGE